MQAPSAARHAKTSAARNLVVVLVGVAVAFALGSLAVGEAEVLGKDGSPARVVSPAETPTPSAAAAHPRAERVSVPHTQGQVSRPGRHWQRVLGSLDRARSKAWRHSRPALLRRVYLPSAPEWREDRSMLRAYAQRGLRVQGVRLAFGSVEVAHRAPGVVRLQVVDQLRAAIAVDEQGRRLELPRDRPSRHTIVLRRLGSDWRIADVRVR